MSHFEDVADTGSAGANPHRADPGDAGSSPAAEEGGRFERGVSLDRLVFFSDAVIAIAMTLLALALPVPQGSSNRALWHSFVGYLDQDYLTFFISFVVISTFWRSHHQFFDRVRAADTRLVRLNLLYLMGIVVLPFATKVLGADGQFAFGTALYATTVALVAASFAAIAWYSRRAGLLAPATGRGSAATASLTVAVVFALSIGIALWNPGAAKYFWLVLIVIGPIADRIVRRRARD